MHLVGIATFSAFVETSIKRITCEFSGASCLPGPTTNGGGDRSSRSSLSSYHPDVPGAIVGVFVPRYETDSTFASTSLQRNETAIAFASDERPFLGHFDPAKVLPVSMERAAWLAKVLVVSMGRAVWRAKVLVVLRGRAAWRAKVLLVSKLRRHRVLCAKKFALRGPEWVCARKSSPCKPKTGEKCCFQACRANFFAEQPLKALTVSVRRRVGSPCGRLSSAGEKFRMQFPSRHFE